LPVAELAGMWKNNFLAQFDPFPVVFFFVFFHFVVCLNKIKRIIAKRKRMNTLKNLFLFNDKKKFFIFSSVCSFVRTQSRQKGKRVNAQPPISPI
jgi:hypothetical protein